MNKKIFIFIVKKNFIVLEYEDDCCVMKIFIVWGKKIDGVWNNKGVLSNYGDDVENKVDWLKLNLYFIYYFYFKYYFEIECLM